MLGGGGLHTVRGGIYAGGHRFRPRFVGVSCRGIEGFPIGGWGRITPWCRWLHEPQPISNQSKELGFLRRAGWCVALGAVTVFVLDSLENYFMEEFIILGRGRIFPGYR